MKPASHSFLSGCLSLFAAFGFASEARAGERTLPTQGVAPMNDGDGPVDPVLVWSTFLGGDGRDSAVDVAVGPQGEAVVVGNTAFGALDTQGLPLIKHGPPLPFFVDTTPDAMVIKYGPGLQAAAYVVTVGGSLRDDALAVAVDGQGNAVVLMRTESLDFPTRNALQSNLRGDSDLAVVKLGPNGLDVIFSTYLGGDFHELWLSGGADLALDPAGNIYIAGTTHSQDFPVSAGAFQRAPGAGTPNGIITKLSPTGALLYSTYLGGNGNDVCQAIAVDAEGYAYIAGTTSSGDFPLIRPLATTRGVAASEPDPGVLFVARLNPGGTALDFSTFLIGSGAVNALAVTPSRGVVLAGRSSAGLTTTPNALQRSTGGGFVLELNSSLYAVTYASHLGGSTEARRLAVDPNGNLAITGTTSSSSLVTTHDDFVAQSPFNTSADAFIVKLDPNRQAVFSIRLGGSASDDGRGVAFLPDGDILLTGATQSFDFPLAAASRTVPISDDAFIARITEVPGSGSNQGGSDPILVTERYTDRSAATVTHRFYRVRELRP